MLDLEKRKLQIENLSREEKQQALKIRRLAWEALESATRKRITTTLSEEMQQQRVSIIAPIIADYLKLNQKYRVENANTLVEYDREQKTLTYIDKNDKNEFLIARLSDNGSWKNLGSSISKTKEDYFINVVNKKISELKPKINSKLKPKRFR